MADQIVDTGVRTMPVELSRIAVPPGPVSLPRPEHLAAIEASADLLEANHIVGHNARDIRSRPFNLLRAQVLKEMRAKDWRMIGISSATPDAGKSFLSANLAVALGQLHEINVYLFDLDLRRASLADTFGLAGAHGLNDFLDGTTGDLKSIGHHLDNLNLTIFPSYRSRVNSAELLVSERFGQLIAAMKALPDDSIILCDLPPAFANDDAMTIIQALDAYLFVIEEGRTTKNQVKDSMQMFAPAPCLGTVINRFNTSTSDSYGYGGEYGRYYSS
jgi:capsular exopolysaccharide synthesis family protein